MEDLFSDDFDPNKVASDDIDDKVFWDDLNAFLNSLHPSVFDSNVSLEVIKFDLTNGVLPKYDDLSKRGRQFCHLIFQLNNDMDPVITLLMAFYFDVYVPMRSGISLTELDIAYFKAFSNPASKLFNPIFQNVLDANPTLREKISAIVVDPKYDWVFWF
jgi:hypothetical protein